MKYKTLFIVIQIFFLFSSFNINTNKKYLPIRIKIIENSTFKNDLIFNLISDFSNKKIKVVSTNEAKNLVEEEMKRANKNVFKM
jgi:hypothetical protein